MNRLRKRPAGTPSQMAGASARPMPNNRSAAPSRTARPQDDVKKRERAAKDAAVAKISQQFNIPEDVLQGFTLQELQVLPKALSKLDQYRNADQEAGKPMGRSAPQMEDDLKREMIVKQRGG